MKHTLRFLYYLGTTPLIVHAATLEDAQRLLDTLYPSRNACVYGISAN